MNASKVKKIVLVSLLVCAVALGGGYAAYHAYTSARQVRLLKQARTYLAKPNERKAMLCLQRALRYNPKDVEACRLMAQLYERTRSPAALVMRSRVVELNPRSLEDRLALAQTALVFRDYASATNALEGVAAADKQTPAYHNVAGVVASTAGQLAEAELHFTEAERLEPTNPAPKLNLAVVWLRSTNEAALARARSSLREVSTNPFNASLRCSAKRELVGDAIRFKQVDAALTLSKDLLQDTNSVFSDRLLRLEVLRGRPKAEFQAALAGYQREAGEDPVKIYELGAWQLAKVSPAETLAWLQSLPLKIQTNQPVTMLISDGMSARQDWSGVQKWLEHQNWAELDFLRHASLSRALRQQNLDSGAKAEWELALKSANHQKQAITMLLRLAAQWKWTSEAEELLWAIVNQYPEEKWATLTLTQVLMSGGRTRPLMMLFSQQVKRSPSDLAAKNNLASAALLLDAQEFKPFDLAREVYEKEPANGSYASTYAFALHLRKKNTEALKVMEQLKPQDLEKPTIAGYYGLILQATGNATKARAYLDWSSKALLLPEERKLFDQAKAGA